MTGGIVSRKLERRVAVWTGADIMIGVNVVYGTPDGYRMRFDLTRLRRGQSV